MKVKVKKKKNEMMSCPILKGFLHSCCFFGNCKINIIINCTWSAVDSKLYSGHNYHPISLLGFTKYVLYFVSIKYVSVKRSSLKTASAIQ